LSTGTIYLIAGPWASGKSTLAGLLPARVPECVVFDWDVIIPALSIATRTNVRADGATWPGLKAIWLAIVRSVASTGRDVVLLGPLTASDFTAQELDGVSYRSATLSWPEETIADRLEARDATSREIEDELKAARELSASTHHRIDLDGCSPEEMTDRVAQWIRATKRN